MSNQEKTLEESNKEQDYDLYPLFPVKKILTYLSFFLIAGIIFGCFAYSLHFSGNKYLDSDSQCPEFQPKIQNFSIEYNFYEKLLHNQYNIQEFAVKINRKCPSKSNDINVYIDDILAVRTETLYDANNMPDHNKFNIYDCHKNLLFQVKNSLPYEIYDAENHLIGLTKEENFKGQKNFYFLDENSKKIARVFKSEETWKVEVFDRNAKMAEIRIMSAIFGKLVILENDFCNASFNFTGIIAVVFVIVSLVLMGYLWLSGLNKNKKDKKN